MLEAEMEKQRDRLQKLLRMAGSYSKEQPHEAGVAATRAIDYLTQHPLPLRWRVPKGTTVRVIPQTAMERGQTSAAQALRVCVTHGDNWFFESHRVTDGRAATALSQGALYFVRHNYVVLVPAGAVEIFL